MEDTNDGTQETSRDMDAAIQAKAARQSKDNAVGLQINAALTTMFINKPNDRSELDRRYAIAKTELEKVYAYVKFFIVDWDGH